MQNTYAIMRGMDEGQNNANKANGGSAAGAPGIFSTPELTVDTEKIAQNTNNSEKSRVASIFANTDAGQRSQKLNNAIGVSSQPITEDLVIQNEPKKKSKMPIVVALVVLILAAVGGVTYFVMQSITNNPAVAQTPQEAFEQYINALQTGPERPGNDITDSSETTDDWSIFDLPSSGLQFGDYKKYIDDLQSKYDIFLDTAKRLSSETLDVASGYANLLRLAIVYNSLSVFRTEILNTYLKDGGNAAYEYAQNIVPKDDYDNQAINNVSNLVVNYFLSEQKMIQIYSVQDCIIGSTVDDVCVSELESTNSAYQELLSEQLNIRNSLNSYVNVFESFFSTKTNELNILVEQN